MEKVKSKSEKMLFGFNFCVVSVSKEYMSTKIDDNAFRLMLLDSERRDGGFRTLLKQYGHQLYWHIRRIVVGHDDAEDVLQETCIKVLTRIASFKGDGPLVTWLYRIATNEALQHLRRQTPLFQSIDSLGESLTAKLQTEAMIEGREAEVLFQQALLTLPTQQRIAFNLRYYDELGYDEISRITGKSVGTLKTNYHYATQKVRDYIKQHSL